MEKKIMIGIVDDISYISTGLAVNLNNTKEFKVVLIAKNGKALLDQIREIKVRPDVLFIDIDIDMDVMNGVNTANDVHRTFPEIICIAFCPPRIKQERALMIEAGCICCVNKTDEPEVIIDKLKQVLSDDYKMELDPDFIDSLLLMHKSKIDLNHNDLNLIRLKYAGKTNEEIAACIFTSLSTTERRISDLYKKCGVNNRIELLLLAKEEGWVR